MLLETAQANSRITVLEVDTGGSPLGNLLARKLQVQACPLHVSESTTLVGVCVSLVADRAAQGEGDGRSTERQGIDQCSCRAAVSHLHTSCHWKEVECSGLLWDVGNRRLLNECDGPTHRDCRPLECILLSRGSSCWQTAVATGGWWAHQ